MMATLQQLAAPEYGVRVGELDNAQLRELSERRTTGEIVVKRIIGTRWSEVAGQIRPDDRAFLVNIRPATMEQANLNLPKDRQCPKCETTKPASDFYVLGRATGKGRLSTYCKPCHRSYANKSK